jgi:class 3 adenylate cyclase/tetratricopeptide (TPR) repeat protein
VARSPIPTRSAERCQLTVLFCDLVGSTALAKQLDPEELRSIMHAYQHACRGAIEPYGGHVAQFLGDGVMAYFGWPRAHEDAAERALRAALAVVSRLKGVDAPTPLRVHIGVATGPVVVGESGSGDDAEPGLAVGETPNLAARLQSLAGADEIVIGPATHALAGSVFVYEDLGPHQLRGIVEPVRAWRVLGVSAAEARFDVTRAARLTPLVGREEELGLLLRRWEQAKDGEGQVVLLCGEAGIGKSRIAQALLERIAGEAHVRLRYQCSPYHTQSAFHPIIEQLLRAGRLSSEDAEDVKLAKVEALMAAAQAEDPRAVPLIAALLDVSTAGRYPPLDYLPQKQKDETVRTLARQLIALSRDTPVLLSLEDAHWIDPSSLEAFDHLVPLVHAQPILVVVTFRPEFSPLWAGQSHVTLLTLNRLGARQTVELARRVAGARPVPDAVLQQIAAKTDGVPLFAEELTKSVLESGLLAEGADGSRGSAPLAALAIPATLRDSLMARLDRLAPVKEVAQAGACIGREFDYALLSAVASIQGARLEDALDQLVGSGLVFQRGRPPDATYSFKHALVRDAAYESLLRARRVQIHARIGEALAQHFPATVATQPEIVAEHYTAAELPEKAIPYWRQAGDVAFRRMALAESIAHLERGVGLVGRLQPGADRDRLELDLRTALGMASIALYGWAHPDVESNLARAWELEEQLGGGVHPLRILWGLWVNRLCSGRARESLTLGEKLLALAEERGDASMRLVGFNATSLSHCWLGEPAESARAADAVLAAYDPVRDQSLADLTYYDAKTTALCYKAVAQWTLGYPDSAATLAEEALTSSRSRRSAVELGWVLHFVLVFVFHPRREPERCGPLLGEFERLVREQGLLFLEQGMVPLCRALLCLELDRPREAEAELRVVVRRWAEAGMGSSLPLWKACQAQAAGLLDRLDEALALIEEALAQMERPGWEERFALPESLRIKGWLLQRRGKLEQAEDCFQEAIGVARQQRAKSFELRGATSLARLWQSQGKGREAYELLAPVYAWFTEGFDTLDLLEARALLAELA